MEPERIDWPGLMRLGLGKLRLAPESFWQMTPTELLRALEGAGVLPIGGHGLRRAGLERLMSAYPDDDARPADTEPMTTNDAGDLT